MEKLDLVQILKDCPKDTKLYSPIFGNVKFDRFSTDDKFPIVVTYIDDYGITSNESFTKEGFYYSKLSNAECTLFPSKECRDWSKFKQTRQKFQAGDHVIWENTGGGNILFGVLDYVNDTHCRVTALKAECNTDWNIYEKDLTKIDKFDPGLLKTGDPVLVRDSDDREWYYGLFSHITTDYGPYVYIASACGWKKCIPYNNETKHLVGTKTDAPEFYNI